MTLNRKVTGRAMSIPAGLAVSATVSLLVTLLVVVIGANLLSKEILIQENIGYCAMLALLLGSSLGAVTAAKGIKHRKLAVGMMSGGVYYLLLLGITALFFGGQYQGMGVTLILVLGGSLIGAILANRERGKGTVKRRKKSHR